MRLANDVNFDNSMDDVDVDSRDYQISIGGCRAKGCCSKKNCCSTRNPASLDVNLDQMMDKDENEMNRDKDVNWMDRDDDVN